MTAEELYERQKWTLAQKIDHGLGAIDQFIAKMDGKVYLAFSGGKDSTVLMNLCEILKNVRQYRVRISGYYSLYKRLPKRRT